MDHYHEYNYKFSVEKGKSWKRQKGELKDVVVMV